ncbi:sensor histidine kinase [Mucilaginibacter terrae]|uniref:Sensor histidine kinase YesM n=1 Tax=Mucilaginibacter terrae TaxID=1955052 RepID=A0ABU3GT74_9SPHI|nr:sensor histidine kinase [Mucilaginibacter terrae]MDT3402651.1 sensor histidine kinase YesM [Mucilaginibacter terrae]
MLKNIKFTFPTVFEILIWVFYVTLYKYSYLLEQSRLPHISNNDLPYLHICLYAICSSLYLVPYYRWAVPKLLDKKRYWLLLGVTLILLLVVSVYNNAAFAWLFALFTKEQPVGKYFEVLAKARFVDFNLVLTDLLAFFCIAFARFSYQNEVKRHRIETDHLQLQLSMLKTQLQPHFLFNTLNGLYGMSLTGSKDTPRFILLLSQMMQYILYDCDKETVQLGDEVSFLKGYFELEQKKFPNASISFIVPEHLDELAITPLLFLPLVENSFKHGKHKLSDNASVEAELKLTADSLIFTISNHVIDDVPVAMRSARAGGIGLINIKKRLELYYTGKYEFTTGKNNNMYIAQLTLKLK